MKFVSIDIKAKRAEHWNARTIVALTGTVALISALHPEWGWGWPTAHGPSP